MRRTRGMIGAEDPGQIARRHGGAHRLSRAAARSNAASTLDHAQIAALERLQQLADELAAFRAARKSTLKRLFAPPDVPRGVYLWGGVGRGKSFLMDSFFATVPIAAQDARALPRVHARRARGARRRLKGEADPLAAVAAQHREALSARLLRRVPRLRHRRRDDPRAACSTALFDARRRVRDDVELRARRAVARRPAARALPADDRADQASGSTWSRSTPASTTGCARSSSVRDVPRAGRRRGRRGAGRARSTRCAAAPTRIRSSTIDGRPLDRAPAGGQRRLVRFRGAVRRPALAARLSRARARFAVVFLSDIPRMGADTADQARRFTWLVDILYDHRVKLVASAAAPAEALYADGPERAGVPAHGEPAHRDAHARLHGAARTSPTAPRSNPPEAAPSNPRVRQETPVQTFKAYRTFEQDKRRVEPFRRH